MLADYEEIENNKETHYQRYICIFGVRAQSGELSLLILKLLHRQIWSVDSFGAFLPVSVAWSGSVVAPTCCSSSSPFLSLQGPAFW